MLGNIDSSRCREVEVAFRVPNHFGKDSNEAIKDIVDVLKFGILKP